VLIIKLELVGYFGINFDISSGLSNWGIIFHELIGIAYYKVTNKI